MASELPIRSPFDRAWNQSTLAKSHGYKTASHLCGQASFSLLIVGCAPFRVAETILNVLMAWLRNAELLQEWLLCCCSQSERPQLAAAHHS
jgi:hypothetical protein